MSAPSDSALDHWRSLFAAAAPGIAAATVLQGLLGASEGVLIADGSFVTDPGWQSTVVAVVWWLAWTFSLAAAMIVMRGALIDAPVRASFALRAALRRWPALLVTIVVFALMAFFVVLLAGVLASVLGPLAIGLVIVAALLAASAVGALPLAVLATERPAVATSRAWELGVGRRWYMIGLALCVSAPGNLVTWAQPRIGSWASGPLTAFLLSLGLALASVIVIGFQASILARWYVKLDGEERSLGSRPRPDRWRLAAGLLVAAAVAVSGVTVLNPWGVPVLTSSTVSKDDAGRVVAGGGTVLPDGRRLTVSHDGTGEKVQFEICGGEPYCDTKLPNTFQKTGGVWEHRAALAVGEGLAVVALVQQPGDPADQAKLVVWHCPTVACERTTRTAVGSVYFSNPILGMTGGGIFDMTGVARVGTGRLLFAADVDAQGHPLIAWGTTEQGGNATLIRCADAACKRSTEDRLTYATDVDGRWPVPAGLGFDAQHRLVAVLTDYPERTTRPGLQIRIAEPPDPAPLVATVTCRSADCQDRVVRRWFLPESAYQEVMRPVAGPDGTLMLVTLQYPGAGSGHLIRCQSHCA